MSSNLPLVSIIVPIYNVESYLPKCLNSIISQSYTKLEIILVNDGSTDGCLTICNNYKEKDARIIVIDKENGGLSDARNKGIDFANGEYLSFVDSDDYIHPKMIETMAQMTISEEADIVICGHYKVYDSETTEAIRGDGSIYVYKKEEALKKILEDVDINSFAWDKIYKKELFLNLRYPVGRIFEDTAFTYKVFEKAKKIVQLNNPFYYYLMRENSLSNTRNYKRNYHNFLAFYERFEFVNVNFKELNELCAEKALHHAMNLVNLLSINQDSMKDIYLEDLNNKIKHTLKFVEINSLDNPQLKLKLRMYQFSPHLYSTFYKFFNLIKSLL
ncbi:glycosyltransferase [Maribacter dokdonensis]|uniref:glycosyltransferase n=1 Tax=Maribacter dokdonensis TaxID=320912 RepID=UPI002AB217AC|nr:glycosyltransferase [Maribacter dokdonensis]